MLANQEATVFKKVMQILLYLLCKQSLSEKKNAATKKLLLAPVFVGLEALKKALLDFTWKFLSHACGDVGGDVCS